MPKVSSAHIADVCAGLINGPLLRACTTRHRWSLFLLWHERRSPMAATRTPGFTIAADGNYSIDNCHRGIRRKQSSVPIG